MNPRAFLKNTLLGVLAWFDYRTGIRGLIQNQLTGYRLPGVLFRNQGRYAFWYSLGGLSLFLLGFQFVTGVLLLAYYIPSTREAFDSVQRIVLEIPYGWMIRNFHAVGSHMMIVVVLLHMISVVFMGSYRKPREITWLTGCALIFLTLGICFTGYLLPWSQLSFWATTVATNIPEPIPVVGPWIVKLIRGGSNINANTLNRFFTLHVIVIPAALAGLAGLHLLLVRVLGLHDPRGKRQDKEADPHV